MGTESNGACYQFITWEQRGDGFYREVGGLEGRYALLVRSNELSIRDALSEEPSMWKLHFTKGRFSGATQTSKHRQKEFTELSKLLVALHNSSNGAYQRLPSCFWVDTLPERYREGIQEFVDRVTAEAGKRYSSPAHVE